MADLNKKIGQRIEKLRKSALSNTGEKITQDYLAKEMTVALGKKVSRETIKQWENGERDLKTGAIIALAKFFNVSSDYLLCLNDVESTDINVQGVCKLTKLSERAVSALLTPEPYLIADSTGTLDLILSSKLFPRLLADLSTFFYGRSVRTYKSIMLNGEVIEETSSHGLTEEDYLYEFVGPAMLPRINKILSDIKDEKNKPD